MSIAYTHTKEWNADGTAKHPVLQASSDAIYDSANKKITFTIRPKDGGKDFNETFELSGTSSPYTITEKYVPNEGQIRGTLTVTISGTIIRKHGTGPGSTEEDTGTFTGTHNQ